MGKHFLCTSKPFLDDNGEVKLIIEQLSDITERVKMEEQIRQSQKMEAISTLAGGIAHDFNNMLSVITGNISHVLYNLNKDDELHGVLSDVQQGTNQAQELTRQLLRNGN